MKTNTEEKQEENSKEFEKDVVRTENDETIFGDLKEATEFKMLVIGIVIARLIVDFGGEGVGKFTDGGADDEKEQKKIVVGGI